MWTEIIQIFENEKDDQITPNPENPVRKGIGDLLCIQQR
jgi:hypothetical protein